MCGRKNVIPMKRPSNSPTRSPVDRLHGTIEDKVVLGYHPIVDIDQRWRAINKEIKALLADLQKDLRSID
jgi:hypothetical protein